VHSDLCGKMNEKSLGGTEYFWSFIDETRYVWVYFLKSKDQAFEKFLEWKAMVENVENALAQTCCFVIDKLSS
jgi:hypothetical protein